MALMNGPPSHSVPHDDPRVAAVMGNLAANSSKGIPWGKFTGYMCLTTVVYPKNMVFQSLDISWDKEALYDGPLHEKVPRIGFDVYCSRPSFVDWGSEAAVLYPYPKSHEMTFIIRNTGVNPFYINGMKLRQERSMSLSYGDVIVFASDSELRACNTDERKFSITFTRPDSIRGSTPETGFLHDFIIGRPIGDGKFGCVYEVQHRSSGRFFAAKRINHDLLNQSSQLRLENEYHRVKDISHDNLVKLHRLYRERDEQLPERLWIVMDLVSGFDLDAWTSQLGPLHEDCVRAITVQVVNGLAHLHERNIGHRDIKPGNILLDQDGCVKLTDFGLAKEENPQTAMMTFCGTPPFMAPEILDPLTGEVSGYDKRVDNWALAGCIFYLLTKQFPCVGNTKEINWRLLDGKLSQKGHHFLASLFQTDARDRMSISEAKGHDWLRGAPTRVPMPPIAGHGAPAAHGQQSRPSTSGGSTAPSSLFEPSTQHRSSFESQLTEESVEIEMEYSSDNRTQADSDTTVTGHSAPPSIFSASGSSFSMTGLPGRWIRDDHRPPAPLPVPSPMPSLTGSQYQMPPPALPTTPAPPVPTKRFSVRLQANKTTLSRSHSTGSGKKVSSSTRSSRRTASGSSSVLRPPAPRKRS